MFTQPCLGRLLPPTLRSSLPPSLSPSMLARMVNIQLPRAFLHNLNSPCLSFSLSLSPPPHDHHHHHLFPLLQEHIFKLMKSDSYARFLRSNIYQDLLLARKKLVSPTITNPNQSHPLLNMFESTPSFFWKRIHL